MNFVKCTQHTQVNCMTVIIHNSGKNMQCDFPQTYMCMAIVSSSNLLTDEHQVIVIPNSFSEQLHLSGRYVVRITDSHVALFTSTGTLPTRLIMSTTKLLLYLVCCVGSTIHSVTAYN